MLNPLRPLRLALVLALVALTPTARAQPNELPLPTWSGAVTADGGVTTIADRSASLTFGADGVASYAAELEVKLVANKIPGPSFVLQPAPGSADGKSGLARFDLIRGGGGSVLASGQTRTSIGAPARGEPSPWMLDWMPKGALRADEMPTLSDWNTDDVFGLSRINFDGWRYVGFPLPGHYPGEGYVWPAASQWKYDGDGKVHYPLKVTGVIVELSEKVLHLTDWVPVPKPEIHLRRLVVAQDDSPTVKTTIGEWTP